MRRMLCCLILLCSFSLAAFGAGIPVVDATNIVQNTLAAKEAVAQTLKQIEEYKKQLEQLQEQLRNGMGLGDLTGQFQDMMSGFSDMQDMMSLDPNSIMNQFMSGGGSMGGGGSSPGYSSVGTIDDVSSGGMGSPAFTASPGAGGSDFSEYVAKFGSPQTYRDMPQTQVRYYVKEGAEAQTVANLEWMNALGDHKKRIDENMKSDLEGFRTALENAGGDEEGGTNKLLGQLGVMLAKIIELQYIQQEMMIKREFAEVNSALNANARIMDSEQQMIRVREDDDTYQQQENGTAPLEWP